MAPDPFNLDRFVQAQAFCWPAALTELHAGRKTTHWMWYVFPQLRILGRSPRAYAYGLTGRSEAIAYLDHPLLGPRLDDAVAAVQASPAKTLHALFGSPDDLKFRSSMTLFAAARPGGVFEAAIARWCDGPDPATLDFLRAEACAMAPPADRERHADLFLNFEDRQDWLADTFSAMTFEAYQAFVDYVSEATASLAPPQDAAELDRIKALIFALARREMDIAHFMRGITFEQRQDFVARANAFYALARKSYPEDMLRNVDEAWATIVRRGQNFGWTSPDFETATPKQLFRS